MLPQSKLSASLGQHELFCELAYLVVLERVPQAGEDLAEARHQLAGW